MASEKNIVHQHSREQPERGIMTVIRKYLHPIVMFRAIMKILETGDAGFNASCLSSYSGQRQRNRLTMDDLNIVLKIPLP